MLDDLLFEFNAKYPSPIAIHIAVIAIATDAAHCVSPPPMNPSHMTAASMIMFAANPAIGTTYLVRMDRRSFDNANTAMMHVTP